MDEQILLCSIGTIQFGIRAAAVMRVLRAAGLQGVPGAPNDLLGILNLHGQPIPVVDLSPYFNQAQKELDPRQFFVIIASDSQSYPNVALLVSECYDVVDAPQWRMGLGSAEKMENGVAPELGLFNGETIFRLNEKNAFSAEGESACQCADSRFPA